ncbi:hypothetical protein [Methylobacterium oryzihabitans]|uniref:Uncharacterized protein n=1 Tax=Methylobacterium oryzihabitans TaxID=2499852 RepID=A0A437NZQ9_9HYPH|nr:hypothetical protein [Methylobacterium oryzihabitans]RVU15502.1 hypothetical protein EOE48_19755 [Methylobacterium oryzihabitans]
MPGVAAGFYATTADPYAQVRVERDVRQFRTTVSGDILRSDEAIVSFLLRPEAVVQTGDVIGGTAELFWSEAGFPTTAQVQLTPVATQDGTEAVSVQLGTGPGAPSLTLVRQDRSLRRLSLVMHAIKGLALPNPSLVDANAAGETLPTVMKAASIEVAVPAGIQTRSELSSRALDPQRIVNPAELEAMLREWGSPPASVGLADDWWLHVVFAGRLEGGRDVLGIMYDTQSQNADPPRQGLAVFLNTKTLSDFRQTDPVAWRRHVLFTLAHEIGHALNLPHCAERNAPAALSWMNNPFTFAGGSEAFWSGFKDRFDDDELCFLCHAPHIDIAPGTSNYAVRQSRLIAGSGGPPGGLVALAASGAPVRAAAALTPVKRCAKGQPVPLYRFGEPVFLKFTLANLGEARFPYPKSFDPSDGLLTVTVTRPDGRSRTLRPAMALCQHHPEAWLEPGGEPASFDGIFASFDADGPLFDLPGRYRVTARFAGLPGPPLAAAPATLRVLHPTRAEEIAAVTVWDDPGLMRAIYLRQPLLALDRWQELVERYEAIARDGADPDDTTAAFLRYTAALGWMQRFAPASRKRAREPDPEKAREHLRAGQHPQLPSGAAGKLRRLEDDASGVTAEPGLSRRSRARPRRASPAPPAPSARSRR